MLDEAHKPASVLRAASTNIAELLDELSAESERTGRLPDAVAVPMFVWAKVRDELADMSRVPAPKPTERSERVPLTWWDHAKQTMADRGGVWGLLAGLLAPAETRVLRVVIPLEPRGFEALSLCGVPIIVDSSTVEAPHGR